MWGLDRPMTLGVIDRSAAADDSDRQADAWPMLKGLAWRSALNRLDGNRKLLAELANDVLGELRADPFQIGARLGRGDAEGAADQLHGLRGSAGLVGAEELATWASDMEALLRRGLPAHEATARVAGLDQRMQGAASGLRSLVNLLRDEDPSISDALDSALDPALDPTATAPRETDRDSVDSDSVDLRLLQDDPLLGSVLATPKLLLVDDQAVNLRVLREMFESGHQVLTATDGRRAIDLCRREQPDLVLLNVVMPTMDGHEVCRRLKADPETSRIPIIFVTSQKSPDEEARGLDLGAVDFISKPFSPAVVKARVRTHLTVKAQADMLRRLAYSDGLTGVANRRRFNRRLDNEWRACLRTKSPLSLVMVDIDHFKAYNDAYGHQEGDRCLQQVAAVLRDQLRRARDFCARYGGEEFACLLPDTPLEGATIKARELLDVVVGLGIEHRTSPTSSVLTLSLGVATAVPRHEVGPEALLAAADAELYKAKVGGRNRVATTLMESAE